MMRRPVRRWSALEQMIAEIDRAREAGDTLGGAFEVTPRACWSDRQLRVDARWTACSGAHVHPAIKAVESVLARRPSGPPPGPRRDRRGRARAPPARPPDQQRGKWTEGGVTNGEDLRISPFHETHLHAGRSLRSVDLSTMTEAPAAIDAATCAPCRLRRSLARRWRFRPRGRPCWSGSAATHRRPERDGVDAAIRALRAANETGAPR
jgi:hypothetical protein